MILKSATHTAMRKKMILFITTRLTKPEEGIECSPSLINRQAPSCTDSLNPPFQGDPFINLTPSPPSHIGKGELGGP